VTSPRWRATIAATLLLSILGACSDQGASAPAPSASASGSPAAASTAAPTPTGPPKITLAFGGDVHFAERTLALLSSPSTAFGPVADVFKAADVAMVNLESAVTDRGTPEPKRFHFRAPATAYEAIAAAGIDVVTVANNHGLDYGRVGLQDTIDSAASARMPLVGAGTDASAAYAPWITTVKGVKIAFLGMSQIQELASTWVAKDNRAGIAMAYSTATNARAVAAVKAARAQADVVVVYLHWGQEYNKCPTAAMKSLARQLSEAGATMIVGTHAHVMVGDGWLGKTFVSYGLSNFLWWWNDAGSNDTGVLRVTLSGSTIAKSEFLPAYISRTTGQPIPSTGDEAARISAKQARLRGCTGLTGAADPA
jgi:poly-gamma-glutamate capsule biosynthesis protein CapA/YwtB (metallophosphatase superfamily)